MGKARTRPNYTSPRLASSEKGPSLPLPPLPPPPDHPSSPSVNPGLSFLEGWVNLFQFSSPISMKAEDRNDTNVKNKKTGEKDTQQ